MNADTMFDHIRCMERRVMAPRSQSRREWFDSLSESDQEEYYQWLCRQTDDSYGVDEMTTIAQAAGESLLVKRAEQWCRDHAQEYTSATRLAEDCVWELEIEADEEWPYDVAFTAMERAGRIDP